MMICPTNAPWEAQAIFDDYPDWLVQAVQDMDRVTLDLESQSVSVTRLLQPAWQSRLLYQHAKELPPRSVDDTIPALLGNAWHQYVENLEHPVDALVEQEVRCDFEVDGVNWLVHGHPDLYYPKLRKLVDHKTTRVWSYVYGKREWEEQLNVYALLLNNAGYRVETLQIQALYMDWSKNAAARNPDFPPRRFMMHDVPLWPFEDTRNFVFSKLRKLMDPQLCTPEERWERDEHWALMKEGRKSAIKKHATKEAAKEHAQATPKTYVEHRPGNPVRCVDWCRVKEFCVYGKEL